MMSNHSPEHDWNENQPLSEINIIPLVDVILVLLILFMITLPLLTLNTLSVDLPQTTTDAQPQAEKAMSIDLFLDNRGQLFWNQTLIKKTELSKRFQQVVKQNPQPELYVYAHDTTPYQELAEVIAMAQQAGITKLGLVTKPVEQSLH